MAILWEEFLLLLFGRPSEQVGSVASSFATDCTAHCEPPLGIQALESHKNKTKVASMERAHKEPMEYNNGQWAAAAEWRPKFGAAR